MKASLPVKVFGAIGICIVCVFFSYMNHRNLRDVTTREVIRQMEGKDQSAYDRGFFRGMEATIVVHKRGATNCSIDINDVLEYSRTNR